MTERVSKNIFWLTFSRAIALGLLFLAYTQLFRYLGPFGSGQYQFVLSYVLIFSTIVDFGVQQFITKKMAEYPENTKIYFQNFFVFEALLSVVLYAVLISIALFRHFDPLIVKAISITGLGMIANAMTYPFLAVMTARQDLKKVALINFINSCVNISIIFLAIWLQKYIVFLASIQLAFGVIDLILYQIFIRKHIKGPLLFEQSREQPVENLASPPGRRLNFFDFSIIKNILKSAWPFALLVGFSAIYNRIDVVIISRMLDYTQTGLYTAAYKFFDILNFFPASVSHVLFPVLAGLMAKQLIGDVKLTLEKYLKLMAAVALPVAVGGMMLSGELINIVAGPEFAPAAPVLAILIWSVAILFIYIPVNSLVISQLTKLAVIITGINVVVNIAGNIILLPIIGIKAAAIMTVVSESLQGLFYFYFVRKNITRFKFLSILWKPALAAAVMGFVLWKFADLNVLILIVIGAIIYVLVLIITRFISKDEFVLLKNFFKPDPPISHT